MANQVGGSVVWNLDVEPSKFEAGIRKAKTQANEFGSGLNKVDFKSFSNSASSAFGSVADGIANVTKKLAILTLGAGGIGTLFIKSAADLQQTSKSFEVLTGNVEVANGLFAQLAEYANTTPFEFPDIAKAGQTLLGFGIASNDVFGDITMLGDIAAATGADFQSLALVFGQVNATGKLMGQDSLQLINNRIPITSILAKKLGVSVQEVRKRMEEGAISSQLFNEALKETTQAGGFAFQGTDILAQSLNGRLSTLKDTVLEFGRNLLGVKIDPKLGLVIEPGGLFDRFSLAVPKLTDKLKELGPKVANAFKWLIDNGDTVKAIIAGIGAVFVVAKVAAIGFAIATLPVSGTVLAIVAAVTALVGIFTFLQVKFDIVGKAAKALEPVFNIIKGVFSDLWTSIKDLASVLGKELAPVFEFVKQHSEGFKKVLMVLAAVALAPLIISIGVIVGAMKVLAVVLGFIADHFQGIKKVVKIVLAVAFAPLIAIITPIVLLIKNWGSIMEWFGGIFQAVGNIITTVFSAIYNTIVTVMTAIWNFISPILEFIKNLYIIVFGSILLVILTVMETVKNIIITAWNAIYNVVAPIVKALWTVITTVVGWIWDRLVTAFNFYKNLIIGTFTAVWNFISDVWNKIYGAISGVVKKIIDFFAPAFNWLYDKGKAIVQGLINGIKAMATAVWNGIKVAADKIGEFFSGAASWLYDTGKAIVQGMINGIKDMINKVKEVAGEIGSAVKDKVKSFLGINSPSKVFYGFGQNITEGLINGIDVGMNKVQMAAQDLSAGVQINTGEMIPAGKPIPVQPSNNVNIEVKLDGIMARSRTDLRDIAVDLVESINEGLRAKNLPELGGGKILEVSSNG